jgi:2-C-methyl-D-erythritol 2,4-cyclodiphosphate synthase
MRTGFGYDIHRLKKGRGLYLGGVLIPSAKGELGHSDGDVLIHALIDALLGAAALGDIGMHFPSGDAQYKDISSLVLLQKTVDMLRQQKFKILNIDCTVILEKPKLLPHVPRIKETLARELGLAPDCISIKSKTKEGLDSVGKIRAIEAYAVALVQNLSG